MNSEDDKLIENSRFRTLMFLVSLTVHKGSLRNPQLNINKCLKEITARFHLSLVFCFFSEKILCSKRDAKENIWDYVNRFWLITLLEFSDVRFEQKRSTWWLLVCCWNLISIKDFSWIISVAFLKEIFHDSFQLTTRTFKCSFAAAHWVISD